MGSKNLKGRIGLMWGRTNERSWFYPQTVFVDHRGTLWANTRTGLQFRSLGQSQFQTADSTISENVDITEAPDGSVWMASTKGWVRKVTRPDGSLLKEFPLIVAKSLGIAFTHDGALWIATVGDGLLRVPFPNQLPSKRKTFEDALEHYTEQDGLANNFSDTVFEDREGNVWVTSSRGLDQFRWSKLIPIELAHGATYISMAEDPSSGGLIVGSESLMRTVDGVVTRVLSPPSRIECAYRDPLNRLWLGGVDGLWRLHGDRLIPYSLPSGLTPSGHNVQAMTLDRSGSLWVSFDRNGVYRLKSGSWSRSGGLLNFPTDTALIETTDTEGRIWFGYKNNRIAVLNGTQLSFFSPQHGVNIGNIISIYEAGGRIWIGGDKGLEVLEDLHFRPINAADSEALDGISGIARDANGDMWLNSLAGIVHINADELQQALANRGYSVAVEQLDYLDGLVSAPEQIRPLPSVVETSNGRIYFATRSSVVWVDPRQVPRNTIRPAVDVESVNANGKAYDQPKGLHLSPNNDNLEITYTAPSLLIPERVHFRYFMENLDKGWTDAGDRRLALYSRVPPGRYVFKVLASNDEGLWSEIPGTVTIEIPPSFTQSIWFKTLCAIAILLLLWLVYALRFRQMNAQIRARLYERVAERERISQDLHDTFFQGVQGLFLRFRTATARLEKDQPVRLMLEEVLAQSQEVMLEGRQLLTGLHAGVTDMLDLANAYTVAAKELQKIRIVDLKVAVKGEPRALHPIVFEELYKIGREALGNAFSHSDTAKIVIELVYSSHALHVHFRDYGKGIDPGILAVGFRAGHWGLPGMKERAKKIGAAFSVWSQIGEGTAVDIKVPAATAYASGPQRLFKKLSRMFQRTD